MRGALTARSSDSARSQLSRADQLREQRLWIDFKNLEAADRPAESERLPDGRFPRPFYWTADRGLLFLPSMKLPPIFRQAKTAAVIVVPPLYGGGAAFRDLFVDADLRLRSGAAPSRLRPGYSMHQLPGGVNGSYREQLRAGFGLPRGLPVPPLAYLCYHQTADQGLYEYLWAVYNYLSEPVG